MSMPRLKYRPTMPHHGTLPPCRSLAPTAPLAMTQVELQEVARLAVDLALTDHAGARTQVEAQHARRGRGVGGVVATGTQISEGRPPEEKRRRKLVVADGEAGQQLAAAAWVAWRREPVGGGLERAQDVVHRHRDADRS